MKKTLLLIVTLVLCVAMLCACSAEGDKYLDNEMASPGLSEGSTPTATQRKIYYVVQTSVRVKEIDVAVANLKSLMQDGEWIQSENVEQNRATIVLRIKTERLDDFLTGVEQSGKVLNFTKNSTDVTERYQSNEQRMETLRAEQSALNTMLSKATNMSDMLAIQSRLYEVKTELQKLSTEQSNYDSLVDYSVVTINLSNSESVNQGTFGARLLEGLDTTWLILQGLLIFVICALPFGAIAVGIVVLIKFVKKRKKAKQLAEQNNDITEQK